MTKPIRQPGSTLDARLAKASDAVKEIIDGDAAAVARRYRMPLAAAERLLDDLRPLRVRWVFDPIDERADAVQDRGQATHLRVLDALPKAKEQATAEAARYGTPKAAAVNALAAKMARVSVRTVERIRASVEHHRRGRPKSPR